MCRSLKRTPWIKNINQTAFVDILLLLIYIYIYCLCIAISKETLHSTYSSEEDKPSSKPTFDSRCCTASRAAMSISLDPSTYRPFS